MACPHVLTMQRINQLDVDHNARAFATYASFQYICHTKNFPNLAQIARGNVPKLHYGGTADHFQAADLCQTRENIILNAVGEECVFLVRAKILEGKNGDAFPRDRLACLPVKRKSPNDQQCNNEQ